MQSWMNSHEPSAVVEGRDSVPNRLRTTGPASRPSRASMSLVPLMTLLCVTTVMITALPASAASAATASAKATGNRVTSTKYGFTFLLPKGWNEVALTGKDVGALMGAASKASSSLKKALTSQVQSAASKGLKVFAISSTAENGSFFPNVNVGIYNGTTSVANMDVQAKIQLTTAGAKDIKTKNVHFKFGNALEANYAIPTTGSTVFETQVYAFHGGQTFITTFSAVKQSVEVNAASTVMPSWQFKRKG